MFEILLDSGRNKKEIVCDSMTGICFHGEVPASKLITGATLASNIGLNLGSVMNLDSGWLKFSLGQDNYYIAKKPFRSHLQMSAFFTVSRTVTIGGRVFTARVFEGNSADSTTVYDPTHQYGTEWNKFMYPIFDAPGFSAEGLSFGLLAKYNIGDLGLSGDGGCSVTNKGTSSWLQFRGGFGGGVFAVTGYSQGTKAGSVNAPGWRPILVIPTANDIDR